MHAAYAWLIPEGRHSDLQAIAADWLGEDRVEKPLQQEFVKGIEARQLRFYLCREIACWFTVAEDLLAHGNELIAVCCGPNPTLCIRHTSKRASMQGAAWREA